GDRFSTEDTVEGCFGTFLGGGYSTTGEKRSAQPKQGQYFWGGFDPKIHKAAVSLGRLRNYIDEHVEFWKMRAIPAGTEPFASLPPAFRVLGNDGEEYVVGSNV